nr:RtcB family protein [Candidatus Sigynarchaeota archaeon]
MITDISLDDSASFAARRQLKHAINVLEKLGFEIVDCLLLPDTHPGPEIFPDGLFIRIKGDGIIGNFAKDIACGMAFGRVEGTIPDNTHVEDVLSPLLGGGNHFLEFQKIVRVNKAAMPWMAKWNLAEGDVVMLLHSGADDCGERLEKWVFQNCQKKEVACICDAYGEYLEKYQQCFEHSKEKRKHIFKALGIKMITDTVHNQLIVEADGSISYFMSSNETAQGELLAIPASFGDFTAFVRPILPWRAIPHGTGRLLSRSEAKEHLTEDELKKSDELLKTMQTSVICPSQSRRVSEDPKCYRKMETVVKKLIDEKCVELMFATKPLKTFKV